jgi:transitional endoplasmic reticulum ATPase
LAAPSIIFFDEFDALVPTRGGGGDNRVTERVISQLLTEIDGLLSLQNIVVIAATNRPDMIDPAVLRPGRFDRRVYVPPPNMDARLRILQIKTKDMPLENVKLEDLAKKTQGYSGADIDAICREAAINALRRDTEASNVTLSDFDKVMAEIVPSVTPDMERWYQETNKRLRDQQKPPMDIA